MTRLRMALAALVASAAVGAAGVPAAGAATTATAAKTPAAAQPIYTLPIAGVAKNGKKFTGTYGIRRFVARGDKAYAVGTLKGKLKGRRVTRSNVMMPATLTGPAGARAAQLPATGCTLVHLVLAPVNLNLLGLRVTLGGGAQANQPIVVDVTAVQGAGLLGDLLCGVTNLLNQNGLLSQLTGNVQQLAATLTSIASLLGGLQATQP
ncbi:MAG: hypothetical protein HZB46_10505 [Solirubrobacterales bacterium]|nr:hypothetical protein [Solirubrobacterales bacterium]